MDPVTLMYYALVCGLLAGFLPARLGRFLKLGIGLGVGVASALLLPVVRALFGI